MSVEDEKRAQWGAKLRTKDELWVREQANRQLQPNIWKRVAAEQELARREREWGLAKANERIGDLESELAGEAKKMARRSESPAKQAANLTPGGMTAAIPKLRRRIAELEKFDPASVNDRSDPRIRVLEIAIDETLVAVFDPNTLDYDRNQLAARIDTAPYVSRGQSIEEIRRGLQRGKDTAIAQLQRIIASFDEQLEDQGETKAGHALRAIVWIGGEC